MILVDMELDHVSHPAHKLVYYEKVTKRGEMGNIITDCAACADEISSEHYGCEECNFFLHKLCAQRPSDLTHTLHPLHPLRLFHESPYGDKPFYCDACKKRVKGFVYHCAICHFDLDFICAFTDGSKLNHNSHPEHVLSYEKVVERSEEGVVCAGCLDEISMQSEEHYCCRPCNFFLHKLCVERPAELTHSLHPLHSLQLRSKNPYPNKGAQCDACKKALKGFVYHCKICPFDLDLICAFPDGSKLNHISHEEHVLTYEQNVKRSEKGLVCAACLDKISGRSTELYCCRPCNFFLHKLCVERPSELIHSLHPLYPLQLYPNNPYTNDAQCDACKKALKGFVYHCKICNFDLDLICAFAGGPKLNHISHLEHVLTFEKVVKKSEKDVVCVVCLDEISRLSSEHYSCPPCNVFLHKLCAQAPQELTHSSHTLHPLQLIPKNPYSAENIDCDICYVRLKGFLYHCEICSFTIHLRCALPNLKPDYSSSPGGLKLNHVCHPHILTFEKVVKIEDEGLVCAACRDEISGRLADYYSCRKCGFFLHKLCAERPKEFTHSLHLQHPLRLFQKDFYEPGMVACGACQKPMKGFVYDCRHCTGFSIDFKCAFYDPEKRIQNLEQVHHHPLVFIPRTYKFICDLCSSAGKDEEDQSYACSTCDFLIHKSCALTILTQKYKDHKHPLCLVQGVPEDLQIYDGFYCDVCHNWISPEDLVSHCARCRYFVHVRCMIADDTAHISTIKDAVDYLDDSLIKLILNGDELIHWPAKDISSELIQPFSLGKDGNMVDVQQKIRHFSHEQHDMILFHELCVNDDSFFEEEDEEILCDACIHPISAPYYCCQQCNYYLHSACANLPFKIHHFSHPDHELKVHYQMRFHKFRCDRCKHSCNGFGYGCETCKFNLDLRCAALPAVIIHETHDHPLFQMKAEDEGICNACQKYVRNDRLIFKCKFISCDYYLHYTCAMHSPSMRHRWDRQHPLDLRFPPHGDHPNHFMCDMCEELIHPMHWLYSCFKCDVSFHLTCAPRYQGLQNIKYEGEVQISSHPHILKYLSKPTLKINCDKCEVKLDSKAVCKCETCYHCICYRCVFREIKEKN